VKELAYMLAYMLMFIASAFILVVFVVKTSIHFVEHANVH
jgi:hypothetical protein